MVSEKSGPMQLSTLRDEGQGRGKPRWSKDGSKKVSFGDTNPKRSAEDISKSNKMAQKGKLTTLHGGKASAGGGVEIRYADGGDCVHCAAAIKAGRKPHVIRHKSADCYSQKKKDNSQHAYYGQYEDDDTHHHLAFMGYSGTLGVYDDEGTVSGSDDQDEKNSQGETAEDDEEVVSATHSKTQLFVDGDGDSDASTVPDSRSRVHATTGSYGTGSDATVLAKRKISGGEKVLTVKEGTTIDQPLATLAGRSRGSQEDWTCKRCSKLNRPMLEFCTACNTKKREERLGSGKIDRFANMSWDSSRPGPTKAPTAHDVIDLSTSSPIKPQTQRTMDMQKKQSESPTKEAKVRGVTFEATHPQVVRYPYTVQDVAKARVVQQARIAAAMED